MTTTVRRPSAILLSLALLSGCQQAAVPPAEEAHAAPVHWEAAEKKSLEEWTELLGTTQPLPGKAARVSAGVGGQVLEVLAEDKGKPVVEVKAEQVLVRLDDHVMRATRDKWLATEAELGEMARQAGFAIELARVDVDRLEKLRGDGAAGTFPGASQVERDKARIALQDAEAKQKAAVARQQVARAERKAIEEELTLYNLRSPIAGRLGLVQAKPGDTLAVGTVVAEVIDLDEIDILCFVPAGAVHHLSLDQEARLSEAGEEGDKKENVGRVAFIGPSAQPETGTIGVKVRFPNRGLGLRANTLHPLRVRTESKKDCLTIPESAVLDDQDPPAVLVAEPGKNDKGEVEYRAKKYQAVIGLRDDKEHRVELLGLRDPEKKKDVPLDPHMVFITEGGHGLEDGDLVKQEEEHKEEEKKDEKPKAEEHKDEKKDDKHKEGR